VERITFQVGQEALHTTIPNVPAAANPVIKARTVIADVLTRARFTVLVPLAVITIINIPSFRVFVILVAVPYSSTRGPQQPRRVPLRPSGPSGD
jgi:hypothetical protein